MSGTGAFYKWFRAGGSAGTTHELILNDLNEGFGQGAYSIEPGTHIYNENFAIAKVLADLFDTVERLKNQSDPKRMTTSLARWETILGIYPPDGATDSERRAAIGAKFEMFNTSPTDQATKDYINQIIPELFLELVRTGSDDAVGAVPGGITVTGGVTLPDGDWQSFVCYIAIRLHQPLYMSDQEYYSKAVSYRNALEDFLAAHVLFRHGRYAYSPQGTITVASGSTSVTGSGTLFLTDPSLIVLAAGDELEVFDDAGRLRRLLIQAVASDTGITLSAPAAAAITAKRYRVKGFVLGHTNLDNAFLT